MNIPLFNTYIHPTAYDRIKEVLDTTFLSEGKVVKAFETELARVCELPEMVAVNSGTSALHLALALAGITAGDEVILPAQTFIATGMSILYQGARPVFADIQYGTGAIDPASVEQKITKKTKAILPVDWLGYPCDLDELRAIAQRHNLLIIEDAAQALGARYKDQPIGTIADYTCFSFQAIKHLTTGDGGAVAAREPANLQEARRLRWFGIDRERDQATWGYDRQFHIPVVGYKYHMNNYAAALGLANVITLQERLARRRAIAARYRTELASTNALSLFEYRDDRVGSYFVFPLHVERREQFVNAMRERQVPVTNVNFRIDTNPVFGGAASLPAQARFDATQIAIPCHDGLTDDEITFIIDAIKKGW